MDLDPVSVVSTILRTANALAWSYLSWRILKAGIPVIPLARKLMVSVLFFGMWVLALGSLVQFGFPGEAARFIYTAFTAYALIIAAAIITGTD